MTETTTRQTCATTRTTPSCGDPYPMFRRLRDEAPLYYNAQHDFYALSRLADVEQALVDQETFSSARGDIIEMIKADSRSRPAR